MPVTTRRLSLYIRKTALRLENKTIEGNGNVRFYYSIISSSYGNIYIEMNSSQEYVTVNQQSTQSIANTRQQIRKNQLLQVRPKNSNDQCKQCNQSPIAPWLFLPVLFNIWNGHCQTFPPSSWHRFWALMCPGEFSSEKHPVSKRIFSCYRKKGSCWYQRESRL